MRTLLIIFLSLSLTACVNQEQADTKMAKGCLAGVNALINIDGKNISEIKAERYANEQTEGNLHRRVTLEAIEKDGWLELEKEYSCLFEQKWSAFKTAHVALLVQIEIDGTLYGKKDGKLIGAFDDFLRLTQSVDDAMKQ